MAMRQRYGYNCQWLNASNIQLVTPLMYMDVCPGETISGTVKAFIRSGPAVKQIDSRMFYDAYAFYIPYRLLWDDFPDFIAGNTGNAAISAIPTVSNLWPFNFEVRFTRATVSTFDTNNCFLRRAYNLIARKFFTQEDAGTLPYSDATQDSASAILAMQRPSLLETSPLGLFHTTDPTAASLKVSDLRAAFAQDAWEKMRRFYGDRYVDWLAALGVKSDWTLLTEPEVIAQKHTDWKFRAVAASNNQTTPAQALAQTAGYFASSVPLSLKSTFVLEHGLVCIYGVARCEPMARATPQLPVLSHTAREDWWSPEFESLRIKKWDANVFVNLGGAPGVQFWDFPIYEQYRKGINMYGQLDAATNFNKNFAICNDSTAQPKDTLYYKQPASGNFNLNFDTTVTQGFHYQATVESRIVRNSPVRKVDASLRVI